MLKLTEWTLALAFAATSLHDQGHKKAAKQLDHLLDWLLLHLDLLDAIDQQRPTADHAELITKLQRTKRLLKIDLSTSAAIMAQRLDHMENPCTEPDPDAPPAAPPRVCTSCGMELGKEWDAATVHLDPATGVICGGKIQ